MLPTSLESALNQWNRQIRRSPQNPRFYIQRGMVQFKLARVNEAIQDFDTAEHLDASLTPYLWQRGLAYYYAGRFQEGVRQFEIDLTVNGNDVEEIVWHCLCMAQEQNFEVAQAALLEINPDPRAVLRSVYALFAGRTFPEEVLQIGSRYGVQGQFYSHLYVGLYWEAKGEGDRARDFITTAATTYSLEDYMWHLARVHTIIRGWS